jgi:molybdenum cofactor cytidylyltransferase
MNAAIVLAAGESRRMGAQKVLLPLGGVPVVARIVDQLEASMIDAIIVVVGHEGDRVAEALAGRAVSFVTNAAYATGGMLSSVRCGLRALPAACEAVLVALGDQPSISFRVVNAMARSFARRKKGIVVPVHRGERGHPLLFAARYASEILESYEDTGLRGLLAAHPDDVLELEIADQSILADMDTPDDYHRMRQWFDAD